MQLILAILFSTVMASLAYAKPVNVLVDTGASEIQWKGSKEFVGDSHKGTIKVKKGYITVDGDKIVGGEITIDMTSIKDTDLTDVTYNSKLVNHLMSPDFFDTTKYPEAKYKIAKLTENGETSIIEGDLTVKDKTNPMRITANINKEGKVFIAKGSADFDRSKFNVMYNSSTAFPNLVKTAKDKVIKNSIELDFQLKTVVEN